MRLGSETASLVNHLSSRGVVGQPVPDVGMGVTFLHWTDRSPGSIVRVEALKDGWRISVREDDAKRVDGNGMSEDQDYEFSPRPDGPVSYYEFRAKKQEWRQVRLNDNGRWVLAGGAGLMIGKRSKYHDFSF